MILKYFLIILFVFPFFSSKLWALVQNSDSLSGKRIKWGGVPILALDPDLGLRYGAVINVFDHGKPSVFPDYYQNLNLKFFNSTKGTSHFSAIYEGLDIIKNTEIISEISLINDSKLDFYGFNGRNAVFNPDFIDVNSSAYINKFYYSHFRRIFRARFDLHRHIGNSGWKLFSGISYHNLQIRDINYDVLLAPDGKEGTQAQNISLYRHYSDWGIIRKDEQFGGETIMLTAGNSYDTRNNRINCTYGIFFENYVLASISLSGQSSFARIINTLRYYQNIEKISSVMMFRFTSQQKIAGSIPFYLLPLYHDTRQNQDGVGGAFNLRGVFRNRIAADGFLNANLEFRRNILALSLLNQNWQCAVSVFTDAALITRKYDFDSSNIPKEMADQYLFDNEQKPVYTIGIGVYLIYGENNIISVNLGYTPDNQLGKAGIYVGSAFLF